MKRRSFIQGLLALCAAPVVAKAGSPVREPWKSLPITTDYYEPDGPEIKSLRTKGGQVWADKTNFAEVISTSQDDWVLLTDHDKRPKNLILPYKRLAEAMKLLDS